MNRFWLVLVTLCCLSGVFAPSRGEETASFLAAPEAAKTNIAASPKFDDRVFVYTAESVSASVLEHNAVAKELSLNGGARDGVRFGHAFQFVEPTFNTPLCVAKAMELSADHCVAKLISLDQRPVARSVKGFTAICMEPKGKSNETIIVCRFGRYVWRTESFENKLIRGLLENRAKNVQIRIRQENTIHAQNNASE
jgi:hypothetical protein